MPDPRRTGRHRLLVLASTYPRWRDDPEPAFVHELCKRLAGAFEVVVLTPHARGALRSESMDGVSVVRYRYAPERLEVLVHGGGILTNLGRRPWMWLLVPSFVLGMAARAWSLMRTWRPDVIHAHWLVPQGAVAVAMAALPGGARTPVVVTSHGADLYGLRTRTLRWIKRAVVRRAAVVTVVSRAMRSRLVSDGAPGDNILVAPMGTDLAGRFVPGAAGPRTSGIVLFVGRLVEKKGVRHLVAAMPGILARRPEARLVIAGSGPEEARLRALAGSLGVAGVVDFLGAVPNAKLPALYQRAAVLVAPFVAAGSGDQEGLGLVLVEAIGCGCPVVVGDVEAVGDVLAAGDRALVDPRDEAALARAVAAVLEDPAAAAQAALRRRERISHFDWARVADTYASILRSRLPGA